MVCRRDTRYAEVTTSTNHHMHWIHLPHRFVMIRLTIVKVLRIYRRQSTLLAIWLTIIDAIIWVPESVYIRIRLHSVVMRWRLVCRIVIVLNITVSLLYWHAWRGQLLQYKWLLVIKFIDLQIINLLLNLAIGFHLVPIIGALHINYGLSLILICCFSICLLFTIH